MKDLEKAIELSKEYNDFKVLSLAYAQKGTILRFDGYFCFFVVVSFKFLIIALKYF